ncbi:MAG: hypothetical protein APF84_01420 [Gracilibacter sp. BRH_c7a]|nr:MAG: hypothetical protein APF84_01420 [Gracilibacter sp. BRH_c7a]
MKLFIYEYFSAGGSRDNQELIQAGFAMLDALLKDFSKLESLETTTLMDSSLAERTLAAPYLDKVSIHCRSRDEEKDVFATFREILDGCDAVLIIAPETDSLITKFTLLAEECSKIVFGSASQAIKLVSNKASCCNYLTNHALPIPKFKVLDPPLSYNLTAKVEEHFALPLVIKPVLGTGGEDVYVVKDYEQLVSRAQQLEKKRPGEQFLVQEFIPGEAVSVSCLLQDGKAFPLSLNKQIINHGEELLFQGIIVPFFHPQSEHILTIAVRACESITGLKGFVGVDLVVNSRHSVIMEINARITSAYVALREVVKPNIAEDLWQIFNEEINK